MLFTTSIYLICNFEADCSDFSSIKHCKEAINHLTRSRSYLFSSEKCKQTPLKRYLFGI